MKSLVVLSVVFAVAVAAPHASNESPNASVVKRSIGLAYVPNAGVGLVRAYVEPSVGYAVSSPAYVVPSAVSHQSRVDIKSSPAVVSEQLVQPVYLSSPQYVQAGVIQSAPAVVDARSVYSVPVAYY